MIKAVLSTCNLVAGFTKFKPRFCKNQAAGKYSGETTTGTTTTGYKDQICPLIWRAKYRRANGERPATDARNHTATGAKGNFAAPGTGCHPFHTPSSSIFCQSISLLVCTKRWTFPWGSIVAVGLDRPGNTSPRIRLHSLHPFASRVFSHTATSSPCAKSRSRPVVPFDIISHPSLLL
jgi:hypothetical protein